MPSARPYHATLNPTGTGYWFEDGKSDYEGDFPGLGMYVDLELEFDSEQNNYTPKQGSIMWCPSCSKRDLGQCRPAGITCGMNFEFSTRLVSDISQPESRVLFADAMNYTFYNDRWGYDRGSGGYFDSWRWDYKRKVDNAGTLVDVLPGRHNGNSEVINFAYVDGHADTIDRDKVTVDMLDDHYDKNAERDVDDE